MGVSAVDLDQPFGPRQRLHDETCRDRMHAFDVLAHGAVHRLAVTNVGQVDDHLDEVLHPPARLLNELLDVLHDLAGLLDGVVTVDVLRVVEVLRALAA
jgi:hypothetical protein